MDVAVNPCRFCADRKNKQYLWNLSGFSPVALRLPEQNRDGLRRYTIGSGVGIHATFKRRDNLLVSFETPVGEDSPGREQAAMKATIMVAHLPLYKIFWLRVAPDDAESVEPLADLYHLNR